MNLKMILKVFEQEILKMTCYFSQFINKNNGFLPFVKWAKYKDCPSADNICFVFVKLNIAFVKQKKVGVDLGGVYNYFFQK